MHVHPRRQILYSDISLKQAKEKTMRKTMYKGREKTVFCYAEYPNPNFVFGRKYVTSMKLYLKNVPNDNKCLILPSIKHPGHLISAIDWGMN